MRGEPSPGDSMEALSTDLAGSPYEPLHFLARGGMGEVVVVQHRELGRKLVMKLLRSNLQGQEQLAERMRAEARMLARLSHPNLVAVVDSGRTAGGRPFLVTELLEGETLSDYLTARGGHLPVRESLMLGLQVLAGLSVVHEAGFVHRDLKPANLFVSKGAPHEARRLKILDFGIAKALSEDDRRALGLVAPTVEGAIMGTPSFVSPEQVQSGKVDARTDVYGLGIVLFRLVTGKAPFTGDALALFRAHLMETPPPASAASTQPVPPAVDRLIMKALEKDPNKRFQSAHEMATVIERLLVDLDLESEATEDAGSAFAKTVAASGDSATSASPAGAHASPASLARRDPSEDQTTTSPFDARLAGGTAVIPTMASAALAARSPTAPEMGALSTPSPAASVGADVGSPPAAPIPHAAAPRPGEGPRKTELMRRAAEVVPRDTVRLDAPEALDSPWKSAPAAARRNVGPRPLAAPRGTWLTTWGPILAAVVAASLVLLVLFAWKSR